MCCLQNNAEQLHLSAVTVPNLVSPERPPGLTPPRGRLACASLELELLKLSAAAAQANSWTLRRLLVSRNAA